MSLWLLDNWSMSKKCRKWAVKATSICLMSWKHEQCLNDDNQHTAQHLHLTKETDDEEAHLLTFIALLFWLRIITFFIQQFQVWLWTFCLSWLLWVHLSLCKQSCGSGCLCLENQHACLVSSRVDIVTVAAFWTFFFNDCCFDSQLAEAIVIMLLVVSKIANFTCLSLLTAGSQTSKRRLNSTLLERRVCTLLQIRYSTNQVFHCIVYIPVHTCSTKKFLAKLVW